METNCTPEDAHLFFSPETHEIAQAKEICRDCPSRSACLQRAIVMNEIGVWGGLDETERRLYVRQFGRVVGANQSLDTQVIIQRGREAERERKLAAS